jgi:hypothetical protein
MRPTHQVHAHRRKCDRVPPERSCHDMSVIRPLARRSSAEGRTGAAWPVNRPFRA